MFGPPLVDTKKILAPPYQQPSRRRKLAPPPAYPCWNVDGARWPRPGLASRSSTQLTGNARLSQPVSWKSISGRTSDGEHLQRAAVLGFAGDVVEKTVEARADVAVRARPVFCQIRNAGRGIRRHRFMREVPHVGKRYDCRPEADRADLPRIRSHGDDRRQSYFQCPSLRRCTRCPTASRRRSSCECCR